MEVCMSSETLVSYHINALLLNPEDFYMYLQRSENIKSRACTTIYLYGTFYSERYISRGWKYRCGDIILGHTVYGTELHS
jgi:hypothetical protein